MIERRNSGPYRELERENIEQSVERFVKEQNIVDYDPRERATHAEIKARGFVMKEGQLIDLLK
jgi:hypothetical protein